MKIPVLAKSGPRLVTAGLVCACALVCAAKLAPSATSAATSKRNILGIYDLLTWLDFVVPQHASRPCGANGLQSHPVTGRDVLFRDETRSYLLERAKPDYAAIFWPRQSRCLGR